MANEISKTQIDRLGARLKKGDISESDLRLLDQYRLSFAGAYEFVVGAIRNTLALEPTGRPAKSTTSIAEKLVRESIRLTQIQDIAGCRLIVGEITDQERVVSSLVRLFDKATIIDRRKQPSHGYQAVHVIVMHGEKLVEIQVRTSLQHVWAELSEKLSDIVNPLIKYGGGDQSILHVLSVLSDLIGAEESLELELADTEKSLATLLSNGSAVHNEQMKLAELQNRIYAVRKDQVYVKEQSFKLLGKALSIFSKRGDRDALSN